MKLLDKVLILIFLLYIIGIVLSLSVKYFTYKFAYIGDQVEIREIVIDDEIFYPYYNKTISNLSNKKDNIISSINELKKYYYEYNKISDNDQRLRLTYFDFYSKFKTQVSFLDSLSNNNVLLTDFEKRSILLRNYNLPEKIDNGIKTQENFEFILSNNTLLGENIKLIYNKKNETIRIQEKNTQNVNQWDNIYVGRLALNNMSNEYVYNISIIDNNEGGTFLIIYSINKEGRLRNHYVEVKFNEKRIETIVNRFTSNIITKSMEDLNCNLQYRYLYVNIEKNTLELFCRSSISGKNLKVLLLSNKN